MLNEIVFEKMEKWKKGSSKKMKELVDDIKRI